MAEPDNRTIPQVLLDIARGAQPLDDRGCAALQAAAYKLLQLKITGLGWHTPSARDDD